MKPLTSERDVKREVRAVFDARVPWVWYMMPVSNGMGVHGIPDFIGCARGVFLSVETKHPIRKSDLTPLQKLCRDRIIRANGAHFVIRDEAGLAELRNFLDNLET